MFKQHSHQSITLIFIQFLTRTIKSTYYHLMMCNVLCGIYKDLINHILWWIIWKEWKLMMLNKRLVVVNFILLLIPFWRLGLIKRRWKFMIWDYRRIKLKMESSSSINKDKRRISSLIWLAITPLLILLKMESILLQEIS